ncbi:MAG: hypothetical protein HY403_12695 [Elusimicrobia bacterium]|nr:hypothetical protein [Elusimicrobiota bacterium]
MNAKPLLVSALLTAASFAPCQTLGLPGFGALQDGSPPSVCLPADAACQNGYMTGQGAGMQAFERIPPEPPPFDPADFQKELADAREGNEYTVVDLGDNRYGVVDEKGVRVCGKGLCDSQPRPASDFPGLADMIQAAKNINNGEDSLNKDNSGKQKAGGPGAFSMAGADGDKSRGKGAPSTAPAGDPNPGRGVGREFAEDISALDASGDAESEAGGDAEALSGESLVNKDAAPVKVDGVFTYHRLRENAREIDKEARIFNTGKLSGFVAPNEPVGDSAGDPPISPEHLGKIQAVANE